MASSSNMRSSGVRSSVVRKDAKIVVGLDFGTSFSGFAYALRSDPDTIHTFYDWPMQAAGGILPYCKTQTSLLYSYLSHTSDLFVLRDWGWPACVKYKSKVIQEFVVKPEEDDDLQVIEHLEVHPSSGISKSKARSASERDDQPSSSDNIDYFLTLFKLGMATNLEDISTSNDKTTSGPALRAGMTTKRAISDYLSQMSKFVLRELREKFGTHITIEDVQWCLTVPAIWDERAKRDFRLCAEIAELVRGPNSGEAGSPHPLKLFIEPEAASVYCQLKLKDHTWTKGDKFLVVDCGGGTVDLVLHEKLGPAGTVSVREVQESSGAVCGGSQVDDEFLAFLRRKIRCFKKFEREHPTIALAFRQEWERVKYDFDGTENNAFHIDLPPKLATMWGQGQAKLSMLRRPSTSNISSYDEIELTKDDMQSIFDPVVNRILELVEVRVVSDLQAIVVVGGFSASPYLMRRIKSTFGGRVGAIVSPPYPGLAVCFGAVNMGIRSDTVVSRISKRTYGTAVSRPFIAGKHPEESKTECEPGEFYCTAIFSKFVSKGDEVCVNKCVKKSIDQTLKKTSKSVGIEIFSTACLNPKYVTDPGVKSEGFFRIQCPSYHELGFWPEVEVSMYFGRTEIQVTAVAKNFDSEKKEMLPVVFERDSIY